MSAGLDPATPSGQSPDRNHAMLKDIFAEAEASGDWRKATFEAARVQIHQYFSAGGFKIIEHGPVHMPIILPGNLRLPPEDTSLWEIKDLSNNSVRAVALIANADPNMAGAGNESLVFGPITENLNQLLRRWTQQGKLGPAGRTFAIVQVRSSITFFLWDGNPDYVRKDPANHRSRAADTTWVTDKGTHAPNSSWTRVKEVFEERQDWQPDRLRGYAGFGLNLAADIFPRPSVRTALFDSSQHRERKT